MLEGINNGPTDVQPASEHSRRARSEGGPEPEIVLLFTYRLLPDAELETLSELWSAMHTLVLSDSRFGFLGCTGLSAPDGTRITIYRFSSLDGLERFRRHPEHVAVQRRGSEFFEWLRTEICTVVAVHPWTPGRS